MINKRFNVNTLRPGWHIIFETDALYFGIIQKAAPESLKVRAEKIGSEGFEDQTLVPKHCKIRYVLDGQRIVWDSVTSVFDVSIISCDDLIVFKKKEKKFFGRVIDVTDRSLSAYVYDEENNSNHAMIVFPEEIEILSVF